MIGIFDSGVGGLSVLRAVRGLLPEQELFYVADQAHVPYGPRPLEEVRAFSEGVTGWLLEQGAGIVVVACNTASAAALHHLRRVFPSTPFVGMEPAVKPAAEGTLSGVVGVLATPATFQGELYASVVERFARGVTVLQHTCPGLVGQIEAGELDTARTRTILEEALLPMMAQNIDTIVLGCTHYPFVIPLIQEITGPGVRVIDPAPAVARQAARLVQARLLQPHHDLTGPVRTGAAIRFYTTGDPMGMQALLPRLLGQEGMVYPLRWNGDHLSSPA